MKKHKISILFLMFVCFFASINRVYANGCYYFLADPKVMVRMETNGNRFEGMVDNFYVAKHDDIKLKNAYNEQQPCYLSSAVSRLYSDANVFLDHIQNNQCPPYIVVVESTEQLLTTGTFYDVYLFNSESAANSFAGRVHAGYVCTFEDKSGCGDGAVLSHIEVTKAPAVLASVPESEYWSQWIEKDYKSAPPSKPIGCELISDNVKNIINEILTYVRIIVPIMIVALGMYEFFKAMASGEEEMKKTQKRFIQRVLIGVLVFLVPVFVNIIFNLAEVIWENTGLYSCTIDGEEVGK